MAEEPTCVHSKTHWDCRSCQLRVSREIKRLYSERDQLRRLLAAVREQGVYDIEDGPIYAVAKELEDGRKDR